MALAHLNWLIHRQVPEYIEGARVIVRFNSSLHGAQMVLCRICSITYRFYSLTYDVIVLEDKGWLNFGTRTFVFPESIVRQPALHLSGHITPPQPIIQANPTTTPHEEQRQQHDEVGNCELNAVIQDHEITIGGQPDPAII